MIEKSVLLRALIGFFVLLVMVRVVGKKQLGELSFFNYITGIALGNIAGDMVVHKDIKVFEGVIGMVLWTVFTFLLEYISLKSPKARIVLNGEPVIVIRKGIIFKDILSQHRMNVDELRMLLRNKDIFSVKDVDYAILEPNGQLSILKKFEREGITKKDMNINSKERKYIPTEIIVDGSIIERNLKEVDLNTAWVGQQLKQAGIDSVGNVFYAELEEDGNLYIITK